jgi:hypothetical protein
VPPDVKKPVLPISVKNALSVPVLSGALLQLVKLIAEALNVTSGVPNPTKLEGAALCAASFVVSHASPDHWARAAIGTSIRPKTTKTTIQRVFIFFTSSAFFCFYVLS